MRPGTTSATNEFDERGQGPRGRYEILRVVNRGGMGEIALGRVKGTKGFEKLVVLKRLRADAEREDHLQMFDVEQEVMSKIEHPNIVKVFDQPVLDNIPYLAMEYVRGRNLDQIIRQAQVKNEELPLSFSLAIITEVLRGLAFVHRLKDNDGNALGVVHQDMTPSNVMVSFFGEVKITDFGISYVTSRDGGLRKGVLKGKPRYVAPEVLAGKRVNNRADIYGVAVVFYELLTGQALFARNTVKETLAAVARNELPDFASELHKYGDGVSSVLQCALRKDPTDRYRTAEAMAADLVSEAAKVGGLMPAARIGYIMRQLFQDDPDVPEMDPALEEIISRDNEVQRPGLKPHDLEETLQELDRLLGPDQSVDLFTLPPDLKGELADLGDGDPFLAMTPLPDFVWGAKTDAEILQRAHREFGGLRLDVPPAESASPRLSEGLGLDDAGVVESRAPRPREVSGSRQGEYSRVHKRAEEDEITEDTRSNAQPSRSAPPSEGPLPKVRSSSQERSAPPVPSVPSPRGASTPGPARMGANAPALAKTTRATPDDDRPLVPTEGPQVEDKHPRSRATSAPEHPPSEMRRPHPFVWFVVGAAVGLGAGIAIALALA